MNEKHIVCLSRPEGGQLYKRGKKALRFQPSLSQIIKTTKQSRRPDTLTAPPIRSPKIGGQLYVEAARQVTTISTNLRKQVEELGEEEFGHPPRDLGPARHGAVLGIPTF